MSPPWWHSCLSPTSAAAVQRHGGVLEAARGALEDVEHRLDDMVVRLLGGLLTKFGLSQTRATTSTLSEASSTPDESGGHVMIS